MDRVSAASPSHVSYDDYLLAEVASDEKHEWCDGVVYAMSRGSPEHARLTANLCRVLGNALGERCTVYGSEAMLYVEARAPPTYADVSVVCGGARDEGREEERRLLGEAITNRP